MLHGQLHIESCVVALGAAGAILLVSRRNIEHYLAQVEWTTLTFFVGLFIIVGALSETGTIFLVADALMNATGRHLLRHPRSAVWRCRHLGVSG